jgi:hypothetical protein
MVAVLWIGVVGGATAQVYEPNDSFITGTGPIMSGTTYSAGTETDNDADLYFFYVPQRTQMFFNLTATNTVSKSSYVCSEVSRQTSSGYSRVEYSNLHVLEGETETAAVTLDRGKYFFEILDSCSEAGETYIFSITPPGTTSTYEPFAAACAAAHGPVAAAGKDVTAAKARLVKAKRKLAKARARGAKRVKVRRLKTRVRTAKTGVKAATVGFRGAVAAEAAACSVPM